MAGGGYSTRSGASRRREAHPGDESSEASAGWSGSEPMPTKPIAKKQRQQQRDGRNPPRQRGSAGLRDAASVGEPSGRPPRRTPKVSLGPHEKAAHDCNEADEGEDGEGGDGEDKPRRKRPKKITSHKRGGSKTASSAKARKDSESESDPSSPKGRSHAAYARFRCRGERVRS